MIPGILQLLVKRGHLIPLLIGKLLHFLPQLKSLLTKYSLFDRKRRRALLLHLLDLGLVVINLHQKLLFLRLDSLGIGYLIFKLFSDTSHLVT